MTVLKSRLCVPAMPAAIMLLLALLLTSSCKPTGPSSSPARPNIILIVTDDQDVASLQYMPRTIDALARGGVTFSNAFVASPVCIPSRVSILRGQYLHSHNAMLPAEFVSRQLDTATMATVMKSAGYRTALIGKYLGAGAPDTIPPGWDVWQTMLTHNVYFNYGFSDNGRKVSYGARPEDYISTVLNRKVVDFIREPGRTQPFFLYVGTVAPHAPATPPPGHEQDFADVVRLPQVEDDVSDKPAWVREFRVRNPGRPAVHSPAQDHERRAEWHRNRLRTLTSVDDMIGELITKLDAAGEIENTYIFYVSDNGDWVSAHYPASAKLSPYDEGIKVPFLVAGPGVDRGVERTHMVSTVDLLPTFAELAGVSVPPFADGRSLLPLLRRDTARQAPWRDSVIAELGIIRQWIWESFPPPYRLMRSATFKYIEYATGEREYYDLLSDPGELANVYGTLDAQRRMELAQALARAAPRAGFPRDAGP